ncbi:MAG: response regulator [Gemmatimonadaceae bacterium]|nr:response regulator [Gemmatimonadaceae bacterium]
MPISRFHDVADWLPDQLLLVHPDGEILAANRAAYRALGWRMQARPAQSLMDLVEGDHERLRRYLHACAGSREPHPGQLRFRLASGRVEAFQVHCGVQTPRQGESSAKLLMRLIPKSTSDVHYAALNQRIAQLDREIRRRREAEAERQRLESQLMQAQKLESLGVLAGGIAHDFNNILTSILGYCDLALLECASDSEASRMVREAANGARQAAELTRQMLAYSGRGQFVTGPVVLSELVESIARLLDVSISKKCVLRLDLMPNQPACIADSSQLRQVVMNLIINASEAIGDRSGIISVTTGAVWCEREYLAESFVDEGLQEGLYVTLEVSDTGAGMSPETRARIFDPFFTTKFTGRGLGLAAVLGIVRGHGGAIRVYSEAGRGSTFKLLFPAAERATTVRDVPAFVPRPGPGAMALVVEDEESVRAVASAMLRQMGFEVRSAPDGRAALTLFQEYHDRDPLVLMDLTMPHLDGRATVRELHRDWPHARIILMSGYSEAAALDGLVGKGVLGFVQKPFQFEELAVVIARALTVST